MPLMAVLLAGTAAAAPPAPGGTMPGMTMAPAPHEAASTAAYRAAMAKMDRGMAISYTGNADRDFVAGMIPHHQGAIDMARVELRYGKDPEMRRLAHAIVVAQEREIAEMRHWQARHRR